ncbi:MAG: hypothetical protein UY50_C0022G0008 [Parcubacteria group bacterium GW2011_GWA2_49_9]|nr:MAG: hypothetical protein UY50_C0022G0008 [Parcubacteria group bacterium GW2011_GWA2_49_9]
MKKTKRATAGQQTATINNQPEAEGIPGQLTKVQWNVDTILLPRHFRLDHIEAVRRLRGKQRGEAQFPGSSSAMLELTEGISKEEGEEYFRQQRRLVIGTGGGLFGNPKKPENESEEQGKARRRSKTEKMTEILGIKEPPSLRAITRTIKRSLEEDGTPTELPAVIRALPRAVNRHALPNIIMFVQDAVQEGLINHLSKKVEDKGLQAFYDEWKKSSDAKDFKDERVLGTLDKLVTESIARRTKSNMELSFVVQCVYWQGVELCKQADRHRVLMTDRIGREKWQYVERNAVFICADNPIIPRASHHPEVPHIDILVIKNPTTENVAIYVNKNLPKCHNLTPLWRMIQTLELLAMGWEPRDIPWNDLAAFKPHQEVEGIWSCFMRDMRIDNGYNKEDYRPSAIDPVEILIAIQHAFHYRGAISKWQGEHRITAVRKERSGGGENRNGQTQPTSEAKPAADAQAPEPIPANERGEARNDLATALEKAEAAQTTT